MFGISGVRWKDLKPGTPGRILLWIIVPILVVLACGLLVTSSIGDVRGGIGTVGTQEEPEVVSASRLTFDLAAMDRNAADVLLIGDSTGLAETRTAAYQKFESDLSDANSQLELLGSAINTIPDGPATFVAIENQLSQYTQYVSYAMYIDNETRNQKPGEPPSAALQAYTDGSILMNKAENGILAQSQFLVTAEQLVAEQPVSSGRSDITRLQVLSGILIALIVIRLLVTQRRMSRLFRRTVNPLLVLATVTAVIFGVLFYSALDAARSAYDAQDLNGPTSVAALWQARATSADLYASESRWLLDAGDPSAQRTTAMNAEEQKFTSEAQSVSAPTMPPGNVSNLFVTYLDDDKHLRSLLDGTGSFDIQMQEAVAYDTSASAAAYAKYDADFALATSVEQQAFAIATEQGENSLATWMWLPWLWMAGTIALIVLGFAPRLREYR